VSTIDLGGVSDGVRRIVEIVESATEIAEDIGSLVETGRDILDGDDNDNRPVVLAGADIRQGPVIEDARSIRDGPLRSVMPIVFFGALAWIALR